MKKIFLLLLVSISLYAQSFKVGDSIDNQSFKDQFDKSHTIDKNIKTLIVAFTRDSGNVVKDALIPKGNGFLESKNAIYLADISGMPSFVSSFFAIPKMKKYPFTMLLEKDKDLKTIYPYSEEKISIIKLENGVIKDVKYISTEKELINEL